MRAAGARMCGPDGPRQRDDGCKTDLNWGELFYVLERDGTKFKATGQIKDVRPGDIIQFSNVQLAGAIDDYSGYSLRADSTRRSSPAPKDDGMAINIYHQNSNGIKRVTGTTLRLADLQQGRFSIYHPIPRTPRQPSERPLMPDRPRDPSFP